MAPAVLWADVTKHLFSSPFSPLAYMPVSRTVAANHELFVRLLRRYHKPEWGIDESVVNGETVPVAREIVIRKPFCHLVHFRKASRVVQPKLLIVAPLSGHFATLLRDTVRTLLPEHDVWITDWVDAKMVPLSAGEFHLDDYVDYIREFIHHVAPDVHVMSVCQPTVPVLAAVSLMAATNDPALPKTMIMMGGPIDTRRNPTAVNDFAEARSHSWFVNKVIMRVPPNYPGFMRKVYPGFLQHASFLAMNPDRHLDSHRKFYSHLVRGDGESAEGHRKFYDEYNAVLDMPAEYYLDTIRIVFQEFRLPKGTWEVRGKRVQPQLIKNTALFTIEGELDDISGNGQTEAAHALCRNIPAEKRKHLLAVGVGHYGIFSGRKFREMISPQIGKFIRRHG
ncbi:MAG: polyhydroxyalkanoate depolymerase [Burkholderiales bacterium]